MVRDHQITYERQCTYVCQFTHKYLRIRNEYLCLFSFFFRSGLAVCSYRFCLHHNRIKMQVVRYRISFEIKYARYTHTRARAFSRVAEPTDNAIRISANCVIAQARVSIHTRYSRDNYILYRETGIKCAELCERMYLARHETQVRLGDKAYIPIYLSF